MNKTEELTYRQTPLGQAPAELQNLKIEEKHHDQRRFESKGIRESFTETRVLFQTQIVRLVKKRVCLARE